MTDNTDPRVEAAIDAFEDATAGFLDASILRRDWFAAALAAADAVAQTKPVEYRPIYSEGHCPHKAAPGGCPLHNLQCGYPACDRKLEGQQPLYTAPPRPDNADLVERLVNVIKPYTRETLFIEELRDMIAAALHPTEGRQG